MGRGEDEEQGEKREEFWKGERNTSYAPPLQNPGSTTTSEPDQINAKVQKRFNYALIMFNFMYSVTVGWKTTSLLILLLQKLGVNKNGCFYVSSWFHLGQ